MICLAGDGLVVGVAQVDDDGARGQRRVGLLGVLRRLEHAGHRRRRRRVAPCGLESLDGGMTRRQSSSAPVARRAGALACAADGALATPASPPGALAAIARAPRSREGAASARREIERSARHRRSRGLHRRAALLAERRVGLVRRAARRARPASIVGRLRSAWRRGLRGRRGARRDVPLLEVLAGDPLGLAPAAAPPRSIWRISSLASSRYAAHELAVVRVVDLADGVLALEVLERAQDAPLLLRQPVDPVPRAPRCASRSAGSGASPLSVRTLAQRSAIVPSSAPAARTSSAEPRLATTPTTTAATRHTTRQPERHGAPERPLGFVGLVGRLRRARAPGAAARFRVLRSVIEILELVVEARVVGVLRRRRSPRRRLRAGRRRCAASGAASARARRRRGRCRRPAPRRWP